MATHPEDRPDPINAVALLDEPTRRRLYDLVASADAPVGRDQAAGAIGISRELAAFHLDRLANAGLLETVFQRLGTRRGPGAGQAGEALPPRRARHLGRRCPPRDYRRAAEILEDAIAGVRRLGRHGRHRCERAGDRPGRRCGGANGDRASGPAGRRRREALVDAPCATAATSPSTDPATRIGPPPQLPVSRPRAAAPRHHVRHEPRLGERRRRGSRPGRMSSRCSRRSPGACCVVFAEVDGDAPQREGRQSPDAGPHAARARACASRSSARWTSSARRAAASSTTAP